MNVGSLSGNFLGTKKFVWKCVYVVGMGGGGGDALLCSFKTLESFHVLLCFNTILFTLAIIEKPPFRCLDFFPSFLNLWALIVKDLIKMIRTPG